MNDDPTLGARRHPDVPGSAGSGDPAVEFDPATGLPTDLLGYAPDPSVYDRMYADRPPDWLDELDIRPGPPFFHMGTHATSRERWLLADEARPMELAIRSRLVDERRADVVGCLPTAEPAAHELLHEVLAWLHEHSIAHASPGPDEHPLVAAGRVVQEDLCLILPRHGGWWLDAGVLCFPTLWRLHDRLGMPMPEVHEHVPHYDELSDRVDRFFDRLPPGRVVWRRNYSIKPYPHLHAMTSKAALPSSGHIVAADGSPYWLRSERQTFRRLPDTGAIVFAIRVQTARAGVLRRRPDIAARLAETYRSWDEPTRTFKFAGSDLLANFVGWLDTVAEGAVRTD